MFLNKLKQVAGVALLATVFSAGTGLSIRQVLAGKPAGQDPDNKPQPAAKQSIQPKDDRTEIRGTWVTSETVTRSTNRQTFPPEEVKVTCVITEDKILRVGDDGFLDHDQTYKLDPTQRPKAIDVTDPRIGTFLGIYELEGDTLKIYYSLDNRPAEFPGKSDVMKATVYKRVSRNFAPVAQRFANAPGCFWMINPTPPPASMGTLGITYFYDKDPDGSVVVTMAYAIRDNPLAPRRDLRPILLDAGGNRHLPKLMNGGSGSIRNGEGRSDWHRSSDFRRPPDRRARSPGAGQDLQD
jgi:uncharacterized protein (TIGR03067 family)